MREQAPTRFDVRTGTLPLLLAAVGFLLALSACSPFAIRIPDGKAESLRKIFVVPLELQGIDGRRHGYFHGGRDVTYLAGHHDNTVLGKEFGGVVVDGIPVFFRIRALDQGKPGLAKRFETLITGPRERWLVSVDLAEIAARRLKAAGVDATAEREVMRIPGLTRRNFDGVPLDWWGPLYDWYGKDPDPLDLTEYANRGARAVLIVAPGWIVPGDPSTHIKILVKLVDPVNGLVIGRAEADQIGSASRSIDDFPAAFESTAVPAVEKALKDMRLVRTK